MSAAPTDLLGRLARRAAAPPDVRPRLTSRYEAMQGAGGEPLAWDAVVERTALAPQAPNAARQLESALAPSLPPVAAAPRIDAAAPTLPIAEPMQSPPSRAGRQHAAPADEAVPTPAPAASSAARVAGLAPLSLQGHELPAAPAPSLRTVAAAESVAAPAHSEAHTSNAPKIEPERVRPLVAAPPASVPNVVQPSLSSQRDAPSSTSPRPWPEARTAEPPAPPPVTITIGRIEVRASEPARAPARAPAPATAPALSLADYLRRRDGRRS